MTAPSNIPIPDPTTLTTASLLREIAHLRELTETADRNIEKSVEVRLEEINLRLQQRFEAQSKALDAAFITAGAVSAALSDKIDDLRERTATSSGKDLGLNVPQRIDLLTQQLATLIESRALATGAGNGAKAMWGYIVGAIGLASTVILLVVKFKTG
jgi:hypothetical protein